MPDRDDRDREKTVSLGDVDSLDTTSQGQLRHLDDADGYRLADDAPDLRGWTVRSADGHAIGKVDDLLVDTGARRVRYLELELDDDVARELARENDALDPNTEPPQHVLVPVGAARLDDERHDVRLDAHARELVDLAYRPAGRGPAADAGRATSRADGRSVESRVGEGVGDQFLDDPRLRPLDMLTLIEIEARP